MVPSTGLFKSETSHPSTLVVNFGDQPTRIYQSPTAPLASADPVEVTVTFNGFGLPDTEFTGPIGEEAAWENVVLEFGTIAMMVLAVAIISIVTVTAKSRIVPRF